MEFHAKEQLPGLLAWMRQQMTACGGKTAVIGISGGKDSATVAALAVAAYGRETWWACLCRTVFSRILTIPTDWWNS